MTEIPQYNQQMGVGMDNKMAHELSEMNIQPKFPNSEPQPELMVYASPVQTMQVVTFVDQKNTGSDSRNFDIAALIFFVLGFMAPLAWGIGCCFYCCKCHTKDCIKMKKYDDSVSKVLRILNIVLGSFCTISVVLYIVGSVIGILIYLVVVIVIIIN